MLLLGNMVAHDFFLTVLKIPIIKIIPESNNTMFLHFYVFACTRIMTWMFKWWHECLNENMQSESRPWSEGVSVILYNFI